MSERAALGDVRAGSEFATVLLGGLANGLIRIWRGDGVAELRCLEQDSPVADAIGRGVLARTSAEMNRYREIALLDADDEILVFVPRVSLPTGADVEMPAEVSRAPITLPPPAFDIASWTAWGRWLGQIVGEAAARGEYVVAETGGWSNVTPPRVLMGVFPEAGGWISFVEANPAPAFNPWPPATEDGSACVRAPAARDTVGVAGLLAVQAISMWAKSPLDIVLSFGTNSAGAWTSIN